MEMSRFLHRVAVYLGIAIMIVSGFLSYDGFDGNVSGENSGYSILAKTIGIILAVSVTCLQFIFATDVKNLNKTLKFAGIASYGYSVWTNKLGAVHLLGASEEMAWAIAIFFDLVAEPMVAWGMGESLVGDFIGNVISTVFGNHPVSQRPHNNFQPIRPVQPAQPIRQPVNAPMQHKQSGFQQNGLGQSSQQNVPAGFKPLNMRNFIDRDDNE